jgi:hypothetical protein
VTGGRSSPPSLSGAEMLKVIHTSESRGRRPSETPPAFSVQTDDDDDHEHECDEDDYEHEDDDDHEGDWK